jgi:hypothetical protein
MSDATRRSLVVVAFCVVVAGCSDTSSVNGAVGTSGNGGPAIEMQVNLPWVTVENRAPHALVDLDFTIRVGSLLYTATLPRMEANEMKTIQINAFRGPDGAPPNPEVRRPRAIVATATDLEGKKYEVTKPWD